MADYNYTPNQNSVANIGNKIGKTMFGKRMTPLSTFKPLVREAGRFGDTSERILTALAESSAYDVTTNNRAKFEQTVLDKWYNTINFSKTYNVSIPADEYAKALRSEKQLGSFVEQQTSSLMQKWEVEQYDEFISTLEVQAFKAEVEVPDLTTETYTEDDVVATITKIKNTIKDMKFYGNEYITSDVNLSAPEANRMIANATTGNLTLYINPKYTTAFEEHLSGNFRKMFDIDVKTEEIKIENADTVAYLMHSERMGYEQKKFKMTEEYVAQADRFDLFLHVQGSFYHTPLYPGCKFVKTTVTP